MCIRIVLEMRTCADATETRIIAMTSKAKKITLLGRWTRDSFDPSDGAFSVQRDAARLGYVFWECRSRFSLFTGAPQIGQISGSDDLSMTPMKTVPDRNR